MKWDLQELMQEFMQEVWTNSLCIENTRMGRILWSNEISVSALQIPIPTPFQHGTTESSVSCKDKTNSTLNWKQGSSDVK